MANKIRPREPNRTKRNNRQSREIPIYERLLLLNLHARAIGAVIKELSTEGAVLKNEAVYFGLMVEEARASLVRTFLKPWTLVRSTLQLSYRSGDCDWRRNSSNKKMRCSRGS